MYAVIELLENTVFDQFGINYPTGKTVYGLLVGIVTKHDTTFIIIQDYTKEVVAYNTKHFSIMYFELEDFSFKFIEEDKNLTGSATTRRYIFADCTETDQKEILEECQRYLVHRASGPTSDICPGCFSPVNDWLNTPNRWKNKNEAGKLLTPDSDFVTYRKTETNKEAEAWGNIWNNHNKPKIYTAPKKSVMAFKRKGKFPEADLEAMRQKVIAVGNKKIKPAPIKVEKKELQGATAGFPVGRHNVYYDDM